MKISRTAQKTVLLVSAAAVCAGAVLGYGLHVAAEGAPTTQPLFYAGTVSSKDGDPLDGMHAIGVSLFGAASDGAALCSTSTLQVPVAVGRFRVELPSGSKGCREAVANNPDTWIELTVDGTTFPRTKVGAVPYAIEADHSKSATAVTGSQADSLTKLNATVTSLQATVAMLSSSPTTTTPPVTTTPKLKSRVIKEPTDCVYNSAANATVCTCNPGEIIVGAGAWAGIDGALNSSGHQDRGGDANDADRQRISTLSCATFTGGAHAAPVQCQFVQATCISL
jgi:hypothetical protein